MATYTQITTQEFEDFVYNTLKFPQEHNPMPLPNTKEKVYGKVYQRDGQLYSVRIYSSLTGDKVRKVGKDAIRVEVYYKNQEGKAVRLGGSKRVHRVEGWRHNLQNRIDNWAEQIGPPCPICNAPTTLRKPKKNQSWNAFFGCSNYPNCKGTCKSTN